MVITENDIQVKYMTENECYKSNKWMDESKLKIMVHSTGCPATPASQWFDRWNNDKRSACVHAFLDDKECWQYLPWTMRGWHAGGSANDDHIAFEICEPQGTNRLTNAEYFNKVYPRAVELCVYLCKKYGISAYDIISHAEGCKLGIACNHSDVGHWFPLHGKNMDMLREDVRRALGEKRRIIVSYEVITGTTLRDEELGWTPTYCSAGSTIYLVDDNIIYDKNRSPYLHCSKLDGSKGYYKKQYIKPNGYKYIDDEYTVGNGIVEVPDEPIIPEDPIVPEEPNNNGQEIDIMIINRVYGSTLYDTAVKVSQHDWSQYENAVIVCTGENYPDAICATAKTAQYGYPVLFTQKSNLPTAVRNEIIRLNPSHVIIIGGSGAVSSTVENQIKEIK